MHLLCAVVRRGGIALPTRSVTQLAVAMSGRCIAGGNEWHHPGFLSPVE